MCWICNPLYRGPGMSELRERGLPTLDAVNPWETPSCRSWAQKGIYLPCLKVADGVAQTGHVITCAGQLQLIVSIISQSMVGCLYFFAPWWKWQMAFCRTGTLGITTTIIINQCMEVGLFNCTVGDQTLFSASVARCNRAGLMMAIAFGGMLLSDVHQLNCCTVDL